MNNRARKNQKGISRIALIVIILALVIGGSTVMGLFAKNEKVETKGEDIKNEITNNVEKPEDSTETEEEIIVPAGHEHDYSILENKTEATCTEPAKSFLKCECGSKSVVIDSESLGHSWKNGETTKAATCQEQGEITYTCEQCNEKRVENTEISEHDFSNKKVSEDYLKSEATCELPAIYYYKCQNCDEHEESTYTEGEALGHKWDEGEITTESTNSKEGEKTYTCTVCEDTRVEPLPAIEE